jgi:hypothetical protein
VPPIDFCSCVDREHDPRCHQTPPLVAVASHRAGGDAPLASSACRAFTAQGTLGLTALVPPRFDVRTPTRIYPNLLQPRHPLSLTAARRRLDMTMTGHPSDSRCAKHRDGSSHRRPSPSTCGRISSPDSPHRSAARLRAVSCRASRKNPTFDRTRGAFHLRDRRPLDSDNQPSWRRSSPCRSGRIDTFITNDDDNLDEVPARWPD